MFDIGFWELGLIGVVALLVIGPDKLPGVARTTGLWVGKARRMVASAKAEIDQELKAEELKKIIDQQAQSNLSSLHEIVEDTKEAIENKPNENATDESEFLVKAIPDDDNTASNSVTKNDDGPKQ